MPSVEETRVIPLSTQLFHLDRFIRSMNSGAGLGFFLFDVQVSESLVKSVVSLVSTLALAFATQS